MTEQLTWIFIVMTVTVLVVAVGFNALSSQQLFALQTNAKLRASELASLVNVLQSSEPGTKARFFIPRSECRLSIYPSFVNLSIGEGRKRQSAVYTIVFSDVAVRPFSAECRGNDLVLSLERIGDEIVLSGGAA